MVFDVFETVVDFRYEARSKDQAPVMITVMNPYTEIYGFIQSPRLYFEPKMSKKKMKTSREVAICSTNQINK